MQKKNTDKDLEKELSYCKELERVIGEDEIISAIGEIKPTKGNR